MEEQRENIEEQKPEENNEGSQDAENEQKDKKDGKKKKSRKDNAFAKVQKSPKNSQIPKITPNSKCNLRLLKLERVKDWLTMEEVFLNNCETSTSREPYHEDKRRT